MSMSFVTSNSGLCLCFMLFPAWLYGYTLCYPFARVAILNPVYGGYQLTCKVCTVSSLSQYQNSTLGSLKVSIDLATYIVQVAAVAAVAGQRRCIRVLLLQETWYHDRMSKCTR